MSDNEDGQQNNAQPSIRDRILSILGAKYTHHLDEISFDIERLSDLKPAVMFDYGEQVSMEKLERFAPGGYSVVEIAGKQFIVNLDVLDRRMPWSTSTHLGLGAPSSLVKRPIFVDISPGLKEPRVMNWEDLPDASVDTVSNPNLVYMVSDIVSMMKEIRGLIADGERIIEKRPYWETCWCPATIFASVCGFPVILWSDTNGRYCIDENTPGWQIEWTDGDMRLPAFKFWVPACVLTSGLKKHLQLWTDKFFDRAFPLPHQNYYMLQTPTPFGSVIL